MAPFCDRQGMLGLHLLYLLRLTGFSYLGPQGPISESPVLIAFPLGELLMFTAPIKENPTHAAAVTVAD